MLSRLAEWFSERWPIRAVVRWGLEEEIPGGASYFYTFGSSLLFIFALEAVTGVWQMLYYVPTTDHAYDSVCYLRFHVPFGWLVHGLHYWGNNAFVILIVVHLSRVFIWGAYRKPRQLTWLAGTALLLLVMAMSFTGGLLPWDQLGYWAGEVGTSIAGTVPWLGDFLKRLTRGGETMGQLALSRFFAVHVAMLAGLLAAFIVIHLVALRQFGSIGPWEERKAARTGWFWPDQVFKDLLVVSVIFVVLVGLTVFVPAPVTGPADPLDTSYTPKPEWSFLFLYQMLKLFRGPWEPVGTVGIPLAIVLILLLVPFADRNPERNPARRPFAMAGGLLALLIVVFFTIAGYYSSPGASHAAPVPFTPQVAAAPPGAASDPPAATSRPALSPSAKAGEQVFQQESCLACHKVGGQGGDVGPDLTHEASRNRSRDWLATQIKEPKANNPGSAMPGFPSLSAGQIAQLVDYLWSLGRPSRVRTPVAPPGREPTGPPAAPPSAASPPAAKTEKAPGPAAEMIGSAGRGDVLFGEHCTSCHGPSGIDHVPNPGSDDGAVPPLHDIDPELRSADPDLFAQKIDPIIQQGSRPQGPGPMLSMPDFGASNSLTQPQIANVEAYVLALNGVNRAKIQRPGLSPPLFFGLTCAAFAVTWAGLGGWWLWLRRRRAAAR
jgi:ubiquinol-cytochrome c reductase cytochrome b subunit